MYTMHPVPYCRTDINLRQLSFKDVSCLYIGILFPIDHALGTKSVS